MISEKELDNGMYLESNYSKKDIIDIILIYYRIQNIILLYVEYYD